MYTCIYEVCGRTTCRRARSVDQLHVLVVGVAVLLHHLFASHLLQGIQPSWIWQSTYGSHQHRHTSSPFCITPLAGHSAELDLAIHQRIPSTPSHLFQSIWSYIITATTLMQHVLALTCGAGGVVMCQLMRWVNPAVSSASKSKTKTYINMCIGHARAQRCLGTITRFGKACAHVFAYVHLSCEMCASECCKLFQA